MTSPPPSTPRSPRALTGRAPPSREEMAAAAQARLGSASASLPGVSEEQRLKGCRNVKQAELEKLIDRGGTSKPSATSTKQGHARQVATTEEGMVWSSSY
jgi:hypothetical protein